MSSRDHISKNLRLLMDRRDWSQHKLAAESKISQTAIKKILKGEVSPTSDTIDQLASAFGMSGWHLMLAYIDADVVLGASLDALVEHYVKSSNDGRNYINRIAEKEADYGGDDDTPSPPSGEFPDLHSL